MVILLGYSLQKKGRNGFVKLNKHKNKPYWYWENYQHWKVTKSLYEILPNDSNKIIVVGNSITYGCEWTELFSNPKINNRGIGGDFTEGVLERLSEITESQPEKIFLQIGTNDLGLNMSISEITIYEEIIDNIIESTPNTSIYIQSVLPTDNRLYQSNDSIIALNEKLEALAVQKSAKYLNLFDGFLDADGNLDMELSYDGLHLNGEGYLMWKRLIEKEVNN